MRAQPLPVFAQYLSSHLTADFRSVSAPHDPATCLRTCGAQQYKINLADAATAQRLTFTLEAYMDQQTIDTVVERRAPRSRADIRFIRLEKVMAICGKSRSSVYDAIKRGAFPRPVKLQGRSAAWIKSEVEQWAVQCIRASRRDSKPYPEKRPTARVAPPSAPRSGVGRTWPRSSAEGQPRRPVLRSPETNGRNNPSDACWPYPG